MTIIKPQMANQLELEKVTYMIEMAQAALIVEEVING